MGVGGGRVRGAQNCVFGICTSANHGDCDVRKTGRSGNQYPTPTKLGDLLMSMDRIPGAVGQLHQIS